MSFMKKIQAQYKVVSDSMVNEDRETTTDTVAKVKDLEIVLRHDLCGTYQVWGKDKKGDAHALEVDFTSKQEAINWAKDYYKNKAKMDKELARDGIHMP